MERDALLNALQEEGIEAMVEIRDVNKKNDNSTLDLNLGWASLMMDGFSISVAEEDAALAREVIKFFF